MVPERMFAYGVIVDVVVGGTHTHVDKRSGGTEELRERVRGAGAYMGGEFMAVEMLNAESRAKKTSVLVGAGIAHVG